MANPSCVVPDCDKSARSMSASLCPKHYHRQYRHGSVHAHANRSGVTISHGRRYRTAYRPGHPVADRSGKVYVHRVVLYDNIGPGPHPCHWCGTAVDWLPKNDPRCLEADHVNHIGDDNQPENVVPACRRCNVARAMARRHEALVAAGWWSAHDTVARLRDPSRHRSSTQPPTSNH